MEGTSGLLGQPHTCAFLLLVNTKMPAATGLLGADAFRVHRAPCQPGCCRGAVQLLAALQGWGRAPAETTCRQKHACNPLPNYRNTLPWHVLFETLKMDVRVKRYRSLFAPSTLTGLSCPPCIITDFSRAKCCQTKFKLHKYH